MMRFMAYANKEELGVEHRESIGMVLYGISILSYMKKEGIKIEGFHIYLLSGCLDDIWKNRMIEETSRQEVLISDDESGRILILATTQGYIQMKRMKIPEKQLVHISEKEMYQLLKSRKESGG